MGMRDEIQSGLAEAFSDPDGLADAVNVFTIVRSVPGGEYNPDTGVVEPITSSHTSRGILANYKSSEIDGEVIVSTDLKAIILQNEIDITPVIGDLLNQYRVINVGKDPAGATHILQLRGM